MNTEKMGSYISPTEQIFADISYLGQGEDENTFGMPRTDPVMRMVDMAAERLATSIRDHLYARHRIMELEQALEDAHREVRQLSMGVLRAGEGAARISRERARQKVVKGYEANHDNIHTRGQLVGAAIYYLNWVSSEWPWGAMSAPETGVDRIRDLEKAGALIAAEIDRLKRKEEE